MKQKLIMALFLSAVLVLTLSSAEIAFADYDRDNDDKYEKDYDRNHDSEDEKEHDSEHEREYESERDDDDKYENERRS